jgi:hypothetical protein
MATTKTLAFASSYTSNELNEVPDLLVGQNGVITGGAVSLVSNVLSIQPLTFIQNGLMVTTDYVATADIPSSMAAPYSVVMYTSSSVESESEVITPTFINRPEDLSSNVVIVADWDGVEWIPRPQLQIAELIADAQTAALDTEFAGVSNGFNVTNASGTITAAPGTLIDQQGSRFTKTQPVVFTQVAADADSLDRIDQITYRRPDDSTVRSGSIEYLTGQTFLANSTVDILHKTQIGNTTYVNQASRRPLIISSTNETVFLYLQDYGTRAQLILVTSPDLMSSTGSPVSLATNVSGFDATVNPDGNIDIVYTRGNNLYYQEVEPNGTSIYAETQIATHSVAATNPRIVSVNQGATYFLHVVYEVATASNNHQLFYVRLSSSNTIQTTAVLLVSLNPAVCTNPSLSRDNNDCLLLLAFENSATGIVYLRQYDASTATQSTPPSQVGTTIDPRSDILVISSSSVLTGTTGATHPVVHRANNKDIYMFWLQPKVGGNLGIGIYNAEYLANFGHLSILQDLTISTENIGVFSVAIDTLNTAHFCLGVGGDAVKVSLNLTTGVVVGANGTLDTTQPTSAGVTVNAKGSLVHLWAPASGGSSNNGSSASIAFIGPGTFGGTLWGGYEVVFLTSTYSGLSTVPTLGDSLTISGAGAPYNGTWNWLSSRVGGSYTGVTINTTFGSPLTGTGAAQFKVQAGTNITFAKTTSGVFSNMRSHPTLRTDVFVAQCRSSDGAMDVSGYLVEQNPVVDRLYEFVNCFAGGGGTIGWTTGTLSFTSAITLQLFNRVSTYTLAAIPGGIAIGSGQVAYIVLPDTDSAASLTLDVISFGSGILDRAGKNSYPLFWNIGGLLYTRFAPFRIESGETILLGDSVSQQMLTWLGATDSVPSTSHGYSSDNYIGDTDSIVTAIGKIDTQLHTVTVAEASLDAIVQQNQSLRLINGGTWTWSQSSGTLTWSSTANIEVAGLADAANAMTSGSLASIIDGNVVYTTINRSGSSGSFTLSTTPVASYTQTDNKVVVARRVGTNLLVGINSSQITFLDGDSKTLTSVAGERSIANTFWSPAGNGDYTLLSGALAALPAGGGVICLMDAATISASQTISGTNVKIVGRNKSVAITFTGTGQLLFSGVEGMLEELTLVTTTNNTLIQVNANRFFMRNCDVQLPATGTATGVALNANDCSVVECYFTGVLSPSTSTGIAFESGTIDNIQSNNNWST